MQLRDFAEADLLIADLVKQLKHILTEAIVQRDHAYLVVSGGKTPIPLFQALSMTALPWGKVTIILADERCVPLTDEQSNEYLVRKFLLKHNASEAHFISTYDEQGDNLQSIEQEIAGLPTFDAVILGMGEDGHTASLFPCARELEEGLADNARALLFVNPQTAPYKRVSLSKQRLLNSRFIFLHILGQKKLAIFHQAMAHTDPMNMPVRAFLHHHSNIQVLYAP